MNETVVISTTKDVLCDTNENTQITSTLSNQDTNATYNYAWYKNGQLLANQTTNSLTVNTPAKYKLILTKNNCTITSNELEIKAFDASLIKVDKGNTIYITNNGQVSITASGANNYQWIQDGLYLSTTATVTVNTPGNLQLIAESGNCSITKNFIIKITDANAANSDKIPNMITPNGDGANDTWILPQELLNTAATKVEMFDVFGKKIYENQDYQNSWPEDPSQIPLANPVFYYVLYQNNNPIKKGTITVIK